jgi:hypothetical protein
MKRSIHLSCLLLFSLRIFAADTDYVTEAKAGVAAVNDGYIKELGSQLAIVKQKGGEKGAPFQTFIERELAFLGGNHAAGRMVLNSKLAPEDAKLVVAMKLASPALFRTLSEAQAKSEKEKNVILENVASAASKGNLTKEQKSQMTEAVKAAADGVASVKEGLPTVGDSFICGRLGKVTMIRCTMETSLKAATAWCEENGYVMVEPKSAKELLEVLASLQKANKGSFLFGVGLVYKADDTDRQAVGAISNLQGVAWPMSKSEKSLLQGRIGSWGPWLLVKEGGFQSQASINSVFNPQPPLQGFLVTKGATAK